MNTHEAREKPHAIHLSAERTKGKRPPLRETAAMMSRRIVAARQILHGAYPRVAKLIDKTTFGLLSGFIVIGAHEPYFTRAYKLIREHERHKGTWTDQDEHEFTRLTNPAKLV